MKKDAYYFPHFSNARHDRKVRRVIKELGIEGYGIYFMLLEVLREQPELKYPIEDIDLLADEFKTSEPKVRTVICNYDLFSIDDNQCFFSMKLEEYLEPYFKMKQQRIEAGKASAAKRKQLLLGVTPQQPSNDRSTTVQQSKVKKSKVNESNNISWKKDFEIYKENLRTAYLEIINDKNWMQERETYYPKADIKLSIDKALKDFWATEAGWENKKRKKTKDINWKNTFNNILANKTNIVWKK